MTTNRLSRVLGNYTTTLAQSFRAHANALLVERSYLPDIIRQQVESARDGVKYYSHPWQIWIVIEPSTDLVTVFSARGEKVSHLQLLPLARELEKTELIHEQAKSLIAIHCGDAV